MSVIVVGNPKPASRTRRAAELVVERLTGEPATTVVELADLGSALLAWGDPDVAAAKQAVLDTDLVVFATPTYKATYTGLLKLFCSSCSSTSSGPASCTAPPPWR